jgi:outer membrane protein TolC
MKHRSKSAINEKTKFMKIFFLGLLTTLGLHVACAQEPLQLSMQQAKELALKNRFDVKANRYDVEIAAKEIKVKKQAFVPDLRITGNVSYHPQIQSVLVPPGFGGASEPTMLALGAKSISVYGLELNQPLLDAGLGTDIKLARNSAGWEAERNRGKEIEIKQRVSEAYLNVLLRDLQRQIATKEASRYSEYYALAKGKYNNGALIENDYMRARLDLQNATQQATITSQQYELSLNTLRHELNVESTVGVVLSDSLEKSLQGELPAADPNQTGNRTELRQLEFEQTDNQLRIKKQRQAVLPKLSVVANYSQQFQNMDFNYNYTDGRWWSPFSAVGLKLNIPLTGHFTNKTSVSQLSLRAKQTDIKLQQQQANISHEITQAVITLANARVNVSRTKDSYELAQKVFLNQQQQLSFGALSYDAVLNTESSMASAEQGYITATYEFLLARLKYEMAVGTL